VNVRFQMALSVYDHKVVCQLIGSLLCIRVHRFNGLAIESRWFVLGNVIVLRKRFK
jgi:hypothetical protein